MADEEKVVAIISPWEKLSDLVKRQFRVESLPAEKKVMVWREDIANEEELRGELHTVGIKSADVMRRKVTARWQDVQ
jgi:hypothetical protein